MKNCKKWLSILLLLALMISCCACTQQADGTTAENTTTQTTQTTQSTAPTETTQPLVPVWTGYADPKTEYTYYYEAGRELEWEEDILYFANSMLSEHPMLQNEIWLIELPNYKSDFANFYDAELRQAVIDGVNALIPQLEDLTDEEIIWELKRLLVLFNDVHTRLEYYETMYFPVIFMPMEEDGETVFYAVLLPQENADLLYAELDAINGYSVEEVIEKMEPYIACETPWAQIDDLAGGGFGGEYLSSDQMLKAAQIMAADDEHVVYTLRAADGQTYDLQVEAQKSLYLDKMAGHLLDTVYSIPLAYNAYKNYWFSEDLAEDTLYVRFNTFQVDPDYTYLQLSGDITKAYYAHGSYDKVIVDLRKNGGGYMWSGYEGIVSLFASMECENFYVLIDTGTYSRSTIFAAELMTARGENALLVGTPCGEAAGFFAGLYSGTYVMPNCEIEFTIPTCYYQPFPAGENNYVIPDVLVYLTIGDYKNCVDTVLQYVLSQ